MRVLILPVFLFLSRFEQVVNLIRTGLCEHRSLEAAAHDVTTEALACGSVDNVSVIILAFHQRLQKNG